MTPSRGPSVALDPIDLGWLVEAPTDFRERLRQLDAASDRCGERLHQLACTRVDSEQARLFNRTLTRLQDASANLAPLTPFRLTILSNATMDLVTDALPVAAARHRVALRSKLLPFDQIFQQAIDPLSELHRAGSDAILLSLDHRWYGFNTPAGGKDARVTSALQRLTELLDALQSVDSTPLILQTVALPPYPLFGSFDRQMRGTARDIDALNAGIASLARERGQYLLDVASLAEIAGTARFHDPIVWNLYKLPMSSRIVPLYADWLGRLVGAIRGTARKCLVLDLDNTIWGGVVGDDGVDGLQLGQGSGEGEAFLEVQRLALELKGRGVILAVCSKNEDATARAAFRDHPEMLLKESDIAVFQANWQDKASNLEAIAAALDISTEALVLLDDNAAERAQVRAALPLVAVPEIGNDAAHYPTLLSAAGYFEAVSFSGEDRIRAESYAANAQRAEVKARSRTLGDYLESLDMVISHGAFDAASRPRIAQLINKSNQFNLTTRRYPEPAIAAIEADATRHTFQTRLRDRYGDFGLIGIIIAVDADQNAWDVDTWLMSCRVLGRQVEWSMLNALVDAARQRDVTSISATYRPTPKNSMVSEHYDRLGFQRIAADSDGVVRYRIRLSDYKVPKLPFRAAR